MGPDAWAVLPALLVLADDVVLWSPAATALETAHSPSTAAEARAPFAPSDILNLVEDGAVKIAARQRFIEDKEFRNSPKGWPGQHWHSTFDDAIYKIWKSEERTKPRERRVIAVGDESGYKNADAEIKRRGSAFALAQRLFLKNRIPFSTSERIQRNRERSDDIRWRRQPKLMAIREVLRDAFNHEDARNSTESQLAVQLAPFPTDEFNRIAGVRPTPVQDEPIERKEVVELLKWIGSLKYAGSVPIIKQLRKDSDQRNLLWRLLHTTKSPLSELHDRIADGLSKAGLTEELLGTTGLLMSSSVVSVTSAAASLAVTRPWFCVAGAAAVGGALGTVIPMAGAGARRYSVIPDDAFSATDRWPFLLATGTAQPTRAEIASLLEVLRSAIAR